MKMLCSAAAVLFALSGCAVDKMIHDDDMKESRKKCAEFGFKPDSTEYASCLQRSVENMEKERDRSYRDYRRREDAREEREARDKKK